MAQRDDVLRFLLSAENPDGASIDELQQATTIARASLKVLLSNLKKDGLLETKSRGHYVLSDRGRVAAGGGALSGLDMLVLEYCVLYGPQRILDVYCRDQQTSPQVVAPALNRLERRGLAEKRGHDVWNATESGRLLWQRHQDAITPDWEKQYNRDVDAWDAAERELTKGLIEELGLTGKLITEVSDEVKQDFLDRLNQRLAPLGPRPDWDTYRERCGGEEEVE